MAPSSLRKRESQPPDAKKPRVPALKLSCDLRFLSGMGIGGSWNRAFLSKKGNAYRSASVERIVEQPSTEASSSFSPALSRQNVSPFESVSCLIALVYPP